MLYTCLGLAILVLVLRDVFHTVLVPRGEVARFRLAPSLVRSILWTPHRWVAGKIRSPVWKAEFLGIFAPFAFVVLLTVWTSLLILGFALILFALSHDVSPAIESFLSALYVAGSFVLTIGCGDYVGKTTVVRLVMLAAAFSGLIITASVVSLLFALIGALHRREILVSLTTNIAGSPPSGIAILETYGFLQGRQSLASFYDDWHEWCADVLESHRAYPLLRHFYSTDVSTSWLTALGAVLDSAALLIASEPVADLFSAKLTYQLGTKLINELAADWNLPQSAIEDINDEDFNTLCLRVREASYAITDDTAAIQKFVRMRQNYASAHQAVCVYISVPQTPLLTERRIYRDTLTNRI